jgi:hypothetical protein
MRALRILAAVVIALFLAGCNPLNDEELRRQVESFQSIAAEGSLLAHDVADDRTKATFVRVHADELASEADDGAQKLNDAPVSDELKPHVERAIGIATRASGALGDLAIAPGDESQGARLADELERIASQAEHEAAAIAEVHQ